MRQVYVATIGNVLVLVFARDVDDAIARIVRIIRVHGLGQPTELERVA